MLSSFATLWQLHRRNDSKTLKGTKQHFTLTLSLYFVNKQSILGSITFATKKPRHGNAIFIGKT
jgi:hypothetical protein